MNILSIDAWRDNEGGWQGNSWCRAGTIDKATFEALKTNRQTLRYLRDAGHLSAYSAGRVSVEDDGYNVVICDRSTGEPIIAIEYGPEY